MPPSSTMPPSAAMPPEPIPPPSTPAALKALLPLAPRLHIGSLTCLFVHWRDIPWSDQGVLQCLLH
eukprot:12932887-Prorocentrum_lima.AAC.1